MPQLRVAKSLSLSLGILVSSLIFCLPAWGDALNYVDFSGPSTFDEDSTILAIVGGHFRSGSIDDVVFVLDDNAIYYRQSNGSAKTFNDAVLVDDSHNFEKVFSADLNNDGLDDLVAIDNATGLYIFLTEANPQGSEPFAPHVHHTLPSATSQYGSSGGSSIYDLAFGDFDDNGWLDIVVVGTRLTVETSGGERPTTTEYDEGQYAVALNSGNGVFNTPTLEYTGAETKGSNILSFTALMDPRVSAGDFNGDAKLDAVFCYHMLASFTAPASIAAPGLGDGTLDSQNLQSIDYSDCQDVQGVIGSGDDLGSLPSTSAKAYVVMAFDNSSRILEYDSAWNEVRDQEISGTPQGPFGTPNDYNFDHQTDLVYTDGGKSFTLVGWDWDSTSDGDAQYTFSMHLGTDIQRGDDGDFDGDGHPDVVGTDDEEFHVYYNNTSSALLVFYSDTDCGGTELGSISPDTDACYCLTSCKSNSNCSDSSIKNDKASSMQFQGAPSGTIVYIYDDPCGGNGDDADDWTSITIIQSAGGPYCVDTFETNTEQASYDEAYYEDNGLNGKVSRICVTAVD